MKNAAEMIAVALAAFLALMGAAFAQDDQFRVHMWILFFVLAVATVFLIRRVQVTPAGPVGHVGLYGRADPHRRHPDRVLGRRRLPGRCGHCRSQLAFPGSQHRALVQFRPAAAAAHLGGDFRLRRHRADHHVSFWVVQRTTRARGCGAAISPGSSSGATSCSSSWRRPAICSASPQSREYAEPEWYVDLWLTIVWVAYLLVFLGTLFKRKEPHIYVANWFYLAFIVTIAMLHVVNNLSLPVSLPRLQDPIRPSRACRTR